MGGSCFQHGDVILLLSAFLKQHRHRFRWQRSGIKVALSKYTASFQQKRGLLLGFDTLGHHTDPEAPGDVQDAFDDAGSDVPGSKAIDERLVDLDNIDGNGDEMRQRRKARPEIVEGDF